MKNKKFKIGITGSIGAGKSLFSKFLEAMNYTVLYADEIAKQLYVSDESIRKKMISLFGTETYKGNELDKKFLSENIFSDEKKLIEINSIVHPAVMEDIDKKIEIIFRIKKMVFIEAALIYEADLESYFDYVLLISAPRNIRLQRKILSSALSEEEFIRREKFQIPDDEKRKRADFTFINDKSPSELKSKAELFNNILNGLITI